MCVMQLLVTVILNIAPLCIYDLNNLSCIDAVITNISLCVYLFIYELQFQLVQLCYYNMWDISYSEDLNNVCVMYVYNFIVSICEILYNREFYQIAIIGFLYAIIFTLVVI